MIVLFPFTSLFTQIQLLEYGSFFASFCSNTTHRGYEKLCFIERDLQLIIETAGSRGDIYRYFVLMLVVNTKLHKMYLGYGT
jgi:hypothetical protein